jgi:hypothetical protein
MVTRSNVLKTATFQHHSLCQIMTQQASIVDKKGSGTRWRLIRMKASPVKTLLYILTAYVFKGIITEHTLLCKCVEKGRGYYVFKMHND